MSGTIIKEIILTNKSQNDFISRNGKIVGFIISLFILAGFIGKPLLWPSKLQSEITEIKEKIDKNDKDIREDMNIAINIVQEKTNHSQELIKKDLDFLKQKVDKVDDMVEFLYRKGGGIVQK